MALEGFLADRLALHRRQISNAMRGVVRHVEAPAETAVHHQLELVTILDGGELSPEITVASHPPRSFGWALRVAWTC